MLTIPTLCRECDRSSLRCNGCRRLFCDYHLSEHQNDLTEQFRDLTSKYSNLKQTLALPPSYESLTESAELLNTISQWEMEIIRQVKEFAEQTREKVRHRSDTITTERFRSKFERLDQQFQRNQQTNNFSEDEIQQLTTQLNDLKMKVDSSLLSTARIRTTPVDWTKYLELIIKQPNRRGNERDIHLDRLTSEPPRIALDVRDADRHVLGSPSSPDPSFLHYQHIERNKL